MKMPASGQASCTVSWNWLKTTDINVLYSHADKLEQAIFQAAVQVAEQMEEEKELSEPTLEQLKRDYIKALDLIDSMRQERDEAQAHGCPDQRIESINGHAISTNPDNPIYAEIDRLKAENERLAGETAKAHYLKERAEKQLAEATAYLKRADSQLAEQGARLAESQVEVQRLKEAVRRLNRGNWLLTKEAQVKEENQNVVIKNLQSALVAMGHEEDCPVVWAASVDCVPGSGCVDYRGTADKATTELRKVLKAAHLELTAQILSRIDEALESTPLVAEHMARDEAKELRLVYLVLWLRCRDQVTRLNHWKKVQHLLGPGDEARILTRANEVMEEALAGKEGENV